MKTNITWSQKLQNHIRERNLKITWQELDWMMDETDKKARLWKKHLARLDAYEKGEKLSEDKEIEQTEKEKCCDIWRCNNKTWHCPIWLDYCETLEKEERARGMVRAKKKVQDKLDKETEKLLGDRSWHYESKMMFPEEVSPPWELDN